MDYKKLIWAILGPVILFLKDVLGSGNPFTLGEQITVGALVLGAIGTWIIPNTPALYTAKTWVNAVGAGTALLATLAGDGLVGDDWLDALIVVLTTAGVLVIPNAKVLPFTSKNKTVGSPEQYPLAS
jgi:hypothetical protein